MGERQSEVSRILGSSLSYESLRKLLHDNLNSTLGLKKDKSYYDVSSFMADQTIVEVVLLIPCPYAGSIDEEFAVTGQLHLSAKRCIKVPLATAGVLHEKEIAELIKPTIFEENVVEILRRDPLVVDVRVMHPFYFEVGLRVANILKDSRLAYDLCAAAAQRVTVLMTLAVEEITYQCGMREQYGVTVEPIQAPFERPAPRKSMSLSSSSFGGALSRRSSVTGEARKTSYQHTNKVLNRSVNIELFLKGLSNTEINLFSRKKAEIMKVFSKTVL